MNICSSHAPQAAEDRRGGAGEPEVPRRRRRGTGARARARWDRFGSDRSGRIGSPIGSDRFGSRFGLRSVGLVRFRLGLGLGLGFGTGRDGGRLRDATSIGRSGGEGRGERDVQGVEWGGLWGGGVVALGWLVSSLPSPAPLVRPWLRAHCAQRTPRHGGIAHRILARPWIAHRILAGP